MTHTLAGVIAATLTPVGSDRQPDIAKACDYYGRLLENGCDGLNILGTTGEAMSFSAEQRLAIMRGLARSGLPLRRAMVGTGSSSLADAARLSAAAIEAGFGGVLVMPPFFYRGVSQDGVLEFFEALQQSAKLAAGHLYLYNFPQMSGTTFTPDLVRRIHDVVPVAGLKDSSNDLAYASALRLAFPQLKVFPSSEAHLRFSKNAGFAGCISGTVALWPRLASALWQNAGNGASESDQMELTSMRETVAAYPLIPAVRYLTSLQEGDATWERPIPPLATLDERAKRELERFCVTHSRG